MVKSAYECLTETEEEKIGREDGGRMGRKEEQPQGPSSLFVTDFHKCLFFSFRVYLCWAYPLL